jgi:hypothetical protein
MTKTYTYPICAWNSFMDLCKILQSLGVIGEHVLDKNYSIQFNEEKLDMLSFVARSVTLEIHG